MTQQTLTTPTLEVENKKDQMLTALSQYVRSNIIQDFSQFNFYEKLSVVQKVPKDKIKTRDVGGKKISYLDYTYCQSVLNFLFNFHVSSFVESCEFLPGTSSKDKKYWECDVTVRFEFVHPDTKQVITRTVGGSHKLYISDAVTKGMAKQAAISKAWTAVAWTFGVGRNMRYAPEKVYDIEATTTEQPTQTFKKEMPF